MHGSSIVQDLVLLYALALVLLLIGGRLRAPVIVSLIATGVIAGPGGLGLVGSEETVTVLSEIGIALLLFMVGLDLSFGEVRRLWRKVVVGGGAQMLGTMAVTAPLAYWLLGSRAETAVFVGFFVAISSTSIIVRELTRRNEAHAPHGSLAIGILLLQDLAALVALVLAPVLFGATDAPSLGRTLILLAVIAVSLTAVTRFLLPVLFRLATVSGREAFGLMVLVASLGTAWLASTLGLSMTVGAFLAGLVLDESEFSHQIHAEIRPLRDLLTSLFFISVGLLVQPAALASVLPWVVGAALAIIGLKTLGATAALLLAQVPLRVAATTALGLAQIGEFSFVLGTSAVANGAIGPEAWQVLLAASVLTMMATPWLVGIAPAFGGWVAGGREAAATEAGPEKTLSGHVLILGFGVGGRLIAWALRGVQTPHVVLELNGTAVREAAAQGHHILYGDATAAEPLRAAGVERAAAVVCVLSDPSATERAIRAVRSLNRAVPILVRTRYRAEAERMVRAGATRAVAEELEASLEVMAELLVRLDVPGNVAEQLVGDARRSMASSTARPVSVPAAPTDQVAGLLGATPVSSYQLTAGDWAVGRSLAAVNLRAETGATILALKRGGTTLTPPTVDCVFSAGDVLYVVGDEASVRQARSRLTAGGAAGEDRSPQTVESV